MGHLAPELLKSIKEDFIEIKDLRCCCKRFGMIGSVGTEKLSLTKTHGNHLKDLCGGEKSQDCCHYS